MALFGTNGVRGIANEFLTPELALGLGLSFGTFLGEGTVAVGTDTRESRHMLKAAAISGLLSAGMQVVDVGIVPTPCLQHFVREHADGGLMVTASHNPREYNGIKLIAGDGTELSHEDEQRIEQIYHEARYKRAGWSGCGHIASADAITPYLDAIIERVDAERIRRARFTVAVDTGCGAGSLTLPFLLRRLGCRVLALNAQVDGTFPARNPEPVEEVLGELSAVVKESGADIGIAQDGDADRAVFVDERGKFVDEDSMLALVADHVLSQPSRRQKVVVTPVSSSLRVVDVAKRHGARVEWTGVGSIYVEQKMLELDAVFGGEGNGGFIFPDHQYCRDGAMAAAVVLEMLSAGTPLSELLNRVPQYHSAKTKVSLDNPRQAVEGIKPVLASMPEVQRVETVDGVKAWFEDGWVLIRPSGTEPLVRVFAESKSEERAEQLMRLGVSMLQR
ncbi:phosphoglucosamine mutase [Methermicoccus shengliensis]|uniref:Phosphoglucosamine mutase n=1 Tax=Methermicoccus shengliensis TaxID=660064 RepID=A0A832RXJ8_9EURY|nr:phosphoglucosamine mutase [Methermicoccus shengliensis]KUK04254.1 MAG: Phosphoglucomutase/phosphomannomutase alpha/beta/alpha domain I [Euryarchaeota archaeon 55_53]KUK29859.1 MAG: Phosphoglucomutase/phosphomannomutase alpha/beta/alpha domain I [Methanosarcinales archeaon 56_1174]MDI3488255.1 phosphomannomutase / phosphoglucomutase [Methanosarcinales archaeon]MDN5295792.1 phosphomannomutase / phosphoglucomutase [Methanosarcinales archaeon]HIH69246.1 phosphoglucosamine mutase [Methermicoccus